jgi:hypothetical protein
VDTSSTLPLLLNELRIGSLRKSRDRFGGAVPLNRSAIVFSHCRWLRRWNRVDRPGALAKGPVVGASAGGSGGITTGPVPGSTTIPPGGGMLGL